MPISFKIKGDYIELVKLLKVSGLIDTGGMAGNLISDGYVKVDGVVELRKRCKINKGQTVEFDNQQILVE